MEMQIAGVTHFSMVSESLPDREERWSHLVICNTFAFIVTDML